MSIAESLLREFDAEMRDTRRVLERVPDGNADFKPHPRSTSLGRLATHLAQLPEWTVNSLTKDGLSFEPADFKPMTLGSTAEMLKLFDDNVKKARAALAHAPDADFAKPWELKIGGRRMFQDPRGYVYRRVCMNHMVHHRAQLGVYLRLLEVPLPGLYGPTADEGPPVQQQR